MLSPDIENPGDRVEVAFRRLDTDGDGYIEEEEFTQVQNLNLTSVYVLLGIHPLRFVQ